MIFIARKRLGGWHILGGRRILCKGGNL